MLFCIHAPSSPRASAFGSPARDGSRGSAWSHGQRIPAASAALAVTFTPAARPSIPGTRATGTAQGSAQASVRTGTTRVPGTVSRPVTCQVSFAPTQSKLAVPVSAQPGAAANGVSTRQPCSDTV
ncbi:MAG: hypothetical protein R3F59_03815 [Myxococcota bacterium]